LRKFMILLTMATFDLGVSCLLKASHKFFGLPRLEPSSAVKHNNSEQLKVRLTIHYMGLQHDVQPCCCHL